MSLQKTFQNRFYVALGHVDDLIYTHLHQALKRIRHEWHTTTTNHKRLSNRLSIVSVHLKQLQTEHQLSNTAMKHLLRYKG